MNRSHQIGANHRERRAAHPRAREDRLDLGVHGAMFSEMIEHQTGVELPIGSHGLWSGR
jgi:hypothetical protein